MIKQSGLINKNLLKLAKKTWYNQRFDGCLNLIWMISEAELTKEKRKQGASFTSHLCIFENHRVDWYIDLADMRRVTDIFLKKCREGSRVGHKTLAAWQRDEAAFSRFLPKLNNTDFTKLSASKLGALYKNFSEVYLKTITSSSLIDGFALGSDEIIQAEINKLLDVRRIKTGRGVIFATLTAPVHQSFINEAELSLLNIALSLRSFKSPSAALASAEVRQRLAAHTKQYFWIKNNYHDNHILSVGDFRRELKTLLASRLNVAGEIRKIRETPKKNKQAKLRLIKKLKPSRYLKNLLELSEEFTYWQDERKKRTFLFTHYASLLLKEIGRRTGHGLDEMKYLARAEVLELLAGRRFSSAELKARAKKMIIAQIGTRYEILSSLKAEQAIKRIFKESDKSHIQDFRGLTASTGKARGRVKIIKSVKEVGKVQAGDILVAVMTRPDYIAGIKKASAIVTDEGGVTCHAAIISRELGIPCVIGTKIGTKVLKDGDLVEVNADHGWIRKVK